MQKGFITATPDKGGNNATVSVKADKNTGAARTTSVKVVGGGIERTVNFSQSKGTPENVQPYLARVYVSSQGQIRSATINPGGASYPLEVAGNTAGISLPYHALPLYDGNEVQIAIQSSNGLLIDLVFELEQPMANTPSVYDQNNCVARVENNQTFVITPNGPFSQFNAIMVLDTQTINFSVFVVPI